MTVRLRYKSAPKCPDFRPGVNTKRERLTRVLRGYAHVNLVAPVRQEGQLGHILCKSTSVRLYCLSSYSIMSFILYPSKLYSVLMFNNLMCFGVIAQFPFT